MTTTGLKFTHSPHFSPKKPEKRPSRSRVWALMATGLVFGFVGMYYTVTKPMSARIQMLEADISLMQTEMHQLVGTRDDLWKTNDLLAGLKHQQKQLADVEQALTGIRQMKNEVLALTSNQSEAMQALQQLAGLQKSLIQNRHTLASSQQTVTDLQSLQEEVAQLGAASEAQQQQIAAAQDTLKQVKALTTQTLQQAETLKSAQVVVSSVNELTESLISREESLQQSFQVVEKLATLQHDLEARAEQIPAAEATLEKMVALEQQLVDRDPTINTQAGQNLQALTRLETKLSSGSEHITSALQTIELLEDFQTEMQHHASSLTKMRRDLMEITFLESTVEQTLKILKPLIQLTDMRRMSDAEVREAARVVMDRRLAQSEPVHEEIRHRTAQGEVTSPVLKPVEDQQPETQKVPTPIDLP